jgi:hypothetical protein
VPKILINLRIDTKRRRNDVEGLNVVDNRRWPRPNGSAVGGIGHDHKGYSYKYQNKKKKKGGYAFRYVTTPERDIEKK